MRAFLAKRWFLVALAVLIPGGLALGFEVPVTAWDRWGEQFGPWGRRALDLYPRVSTAVVLLLMAFSLDSGRLRESLRRPGPVLWASGVNLGLIPLLAWPLLGVQRGEDFRVGLMIAAAVPCTMATASVWTRKSGGNDAVSLLVTLLTNGVCFAVTPAWLGLTLGREVGLDGRAMALDLLVSVLLPLTAGQLLRVWPRAAGFADRHKAAISGAAQGLVLSLVFLSALRGGMKLGGGGPAPGWAAAGIAWGCCVLLHVAGMAVAVAGARAVSLRREDAAAVAFAASQKTLPVGVLLATDPTMFGAPELGIPLAAFPILMYHASQLFIDTAVADVLAARAGNLKKGNHG